MPANKTHGDKDYVARVGKTPTTHATGMRDLLGLALNVRQGEPCDAMRVDFELNCGTAYIIVNGGDFTISLRSCFVVLDLDNCEVQPHTRYQFQLAGGSVEATSTETLERSRGVETGFGVEAGAQAEAGGLVPRLGGWMKANRSGKSSSSAQETVKRQPRIDLIVTAGQDRWQVGDPLLGDARRRDGRLLGSYFGEERHEEGEPKPLCIVAASDPTSASVMTASAVVRLGQLQVHLGGEPATSEQAEDLGRRIRERGRRAAALHKTREADLRARMAGLVLAKAMQAAQRKAGTQIPEGEVLVARQTIVAAFKRAVEVEG